MSLSFILVPRATRLHLYTSWPKEKAGSGDENDFVLYMYSIVWFVVNNAVLIYLWKPVLISMTLLNKISNRLTKTLVIFLFFYH